MTVDRKISESRYKNQLGQWLVIAHVEIRIVSGDVLWIPCCSVFTLIFHFQLNFLFIDTTYQQIFEVLIKTIKFQHAPVFFPFLINK